MDFEHMVIKMFQIAQIVSTHAKKHFSSKILYYNEILYVFHQLKNEVFLVMMLEILKLFKKCDFARKRHSND